MGLAPAGAGSSRRVRWARGGDRGQGRRALPRIRGPPSGDSVPRGVPDRNLRLRDSAVSKANEASFDDGVGEEVGGACVALAGGGVASGMPV